MAFRQCRDNKVLLCVGLFLVACSLCHCTVLPKPDDHSKSRSHSSLSQVQAKGSDLSHGKLLIGQNPQQGVKLKVRKDVKNLLDDDADYQADMGWSSVMRTQEQDEDFPTLKQESASVEHLLKMDPKVECTGDSMKLRVKDVSSSSGSLFVDRGSLSPLPLSKLPASCGYTIKSTQKDLALVAPYDGCFVSHEADSYVLPLLWLGLPVRMSCPLMRQSSSQPPMVTCHTEGMVVKTEWTIPVDKIKVKLNGHWWPLMKASPRCKFSVVVHPEGLVISVHFAPCLEAKDGMYNLELAGDGETKISCPLTSPTQPDPIKGPGLPQTDYFPKNPSQYPNPQVPGFPKNPGVPNKNPNQGPQFPGFPYNPFYPKPVNTGMKVPPAVQPPSLSGAAKDVGPQFQPTAPPAQQPFFTLPYYPWPTQPQVPGRKEPPVQPPAPQYPTGPFYPNVPPAQKPGLNPLPMYPPVVQPTKGILQKPLHTFTFHPTPPPQLPPSGFFSNPYKPLFWPQGKPANPSEGTEQKPPPPFYPQLPSKQPQVEPLYPLYPKPLPSQPVPPKIPVSKQPVGQTYYPTNPWPGAPQGQVNPPLYPQPGTSQAQVNPPLYPRPGAPQGPVNPPLYPWPGAPQGQVNPPLYPWPGASQGQVYPPFYQQPQATKKPMVAKPLDPLQPKIPDGQGKLPPAFKPSKDQISQSFYPHYFPKQPVISRPSTSIQQPQVQQRPQPGSSYMPQYCPQYCPPDLSNCCPQINFHQHVHHIVPVGSKETPQDFGLGLPFLPSLASSGFGSSFSSAAAPPPQQETQAHLTLASSELQSNAQQQYLWPPGGSQVLTSYPSGPEIPEQARNPDLKPKPQYPNLPLSPPNQEQIVPQMLSPVQYNVQSQAQVLEPVNPVVQQGHDLKPSLQYPNLPLSPPNQEQIGPQTPSQYNVGSQAQFHVPVNPVVQQGHDLKPDLKPNLQYPNLPLSPPNQEQIVPQTLSPVQYNVQSQAQVLEPVNPVVQQGHDLKPSLQYPNLPLSPPNQAQIGPQTPAQYNVQSQAQFHMPVNPVVQQGHDLKPDLKPNLQYPNFPYSPSNQEQTVPQTQSPAQFNAQYLAQVTEPVNSVVQQGQYTSQPQMQQTTLSAGNLNKPQWSKFTSFVSQYLLDRANNIKNAQGEGQHAAAKSNYFPDPEMDELLVPYYMLQDDQAPTEDKLTVHNSSQHEKSHHDKENLDTYSGPKRYVLLQQGPPGSEPNNAQESPLLFSDWVHDADFANAFDSGEVQYDQSVSPPKSQQPRKEISSPLPADEPDASDDPQLVSLTQEPPSRPLKSVKDLWKPGTTADSSDKIPTSGSLKGN